MNPHLTTQPNQCLKLQNDPQIQQQLQQLLQKEHQQQRYAEKHQNTKL